MARPKGIPMSEAQKALRREQFSGTGNPFHGKTHSAAARKKMAANHADVGGDKNPFKKSLKTAGKRKAHKTRCKAAWDKRDAEYRKKFGAKYRRGCGDISGTFWARVKSNAKARGLVLEVSIEYCWTLFEQQTRKCALSGLPLVFSNKLNDCTASLDRIDNTKPYIKGNVQWVHKVINLMKRTLTNDEFIEYCRHVSKHNGVTNARSDVLPQDPM